MKALLFAILTMFSVSSFAQHRHYHSSPWGWVAPIFVGGIIGYTISESNKPQVIIQPIPTPAPAPPITVIMAPQPTLIYQKSMMYDSACVCWKEILIKVQ